MNPLKHIIVQVLLLLAGINPSGATSFENNTNQAFFCSLHQPEISHHDDEGFEPDSLLADNGPWSFIDTIEQHTSPCDQLIEDMAVVAPPGLLPPKVLCMLANDLRNFPKLKELFESGGNVGGRFVKAWKAFANSDLDYTFRVSTDYIDNVAKHSDNVGKSADEIVDIAKTNENGVDQFLDELENTPASGHWDLDPFQRGRNIEDDLGQNLPETFKTLDKYDEITGEATSIKSIDLDARTYQNASKLKSRLNKFARELDEFTEYSISGVTIGDAVRPVIKKTLEIAVPRAVSGSQASTINEVIQTWSSALTIKIKIVP